MQGSETLSDDINGDKTTSIVHIEGKITLDSIYEDKTTTGSIYLWTNDGQWISG